jgi:hypothetical protein
LNLNTHSVPDHRYLPKVKSRECAEALVLTILDRLLAHGGFDITWFNQHDLSARDLLRNGAVPDGVLLEIASEPPASEAER